MNKELSFKEVKEFVEMWNDAKPCGVYKQNIKYLIEVKFKFELKPRSFKAVAGIIGDQSQNACFNTGDPAYFEKLFQ